MVRNNGWILEQNSKMAAGTSGPNGPRLRARAKLATHRVPLHLAQTRLGSIANQIHQLLFLTCTPILLSLVACTPGGNEGVMGMPARGTQPMPSDVATSTYDDGSAGIPAPAPFMQTTDSPAEGEAPNTPTAADSTATRSEMAAPAPMTVAPPEPTIDTPAEPTMDTPAEPMTEPTADGASAPAANTDSDEGGMVETLPPTATPAMDPANAAAPFQSLADLQPSPNNIPECPATAPENPWGPCVGVPVYATCDYGTSPAPFYTCICDWIHWICVGFQ